MLFTLVGTGVLFILPKSNKVNLKNEHTEYTKYLPERSRKVGILKNYFVLNLVSPRKLLKNRVKTVISRTRFLLLLCSVRL